jgi:3-oxoacyl-[acyl-carrier protein] reductase
VPSLQFASENNKVEQGCTIMMDLGLDGKTALVTGASAGIGRAIAKALAAQGVKVCVAARRRELLDTLAAEIVAAGGPKPQIAVVDLLKDDGPKNLAAEALNGLGQVNILVNSAGGGDGGKWLDAPDDQWLEAMTFNFTQVRRLTLAIVPDMIKHQWGRIINISGKAEPDHMNGTTPAKVAVHGFAKGLSREVAKHGITVNSIPPGQIMSEQIRRKHTEESIKKFAEREIPMGRFGEPEELAYLAICLASPLARYITGNVIHVDGGQHRFAF